MAGSTAVLTVTAPDGSTSTPAVTTSSPTASATVIPAMAGQYLLVWTVTGAFSDSISDQFTCIAATLGLMSLAEIADQLNITAGDTTKNATLIRYVASASDVVQNITGPLLGQTRVDYFDGDVTSVVLPVRWVKSITSVVETIGQINYTLTETPLGTSGSQFGYTWDRLTHKITRRASGFTTRFMPGDQNVAVTYVQGMTSIPQVITDAAGEIVRHWWSNGQTSYSDPFGVSDGDGDREVVSVLGYLIPNHAAQMLAPYAKGPSVF